MTKTSSQGDFPPAGPGIHGDDGDSSPPCPAQRPEKFQGGPRGPPEALENRSPESTSSGVPFAEPLLANSRNSSTDALRFPIRFNRAIGRPLNSLGSPRIPDPSPARASGEPALRHPPPPGPPGENRHSAIPRRPAHLERTGTPPSPGRPVRPNRPEARPASSAQPQRSPAGQFGPTPTKPGREFARFPTGRSSRGSEREGARPPLHQRHTTPLGSSPGDSVDQDEFAGRFPTGGPRNPRR